jgi:MFS superfamily sulfate permease-like transporter
MLRQFFNPRTIRQDITAGLVLGVESVPDGLAQGVLAAVNPIYGLYGYMVGTFTGAFFTSSVFMAVQATGAMSLIVADVPQVGVSVCAGYPDWPCHAGRRDGQAWLAAALCAQCGDDRLPQRCGRPDRSGAIG